MQYAMNVEHAAAMKTVCRPAAYESRAARCRCGGSCATSVAECRIWLMIYANAEDNRPSTTFAWNGQRAFTDLFSIGTYDPLMQLRVE